MAVLAQKGKTKMKNTRLLSLALIVAMLVSLCATAIGAVAEALGEYETAEVSMPLSTTEQVCVAMSVGSDENDRNFTWYFNSSTVGYLDIAVRNGDSFPSEYETYESAVAYNAVRECYYHKVSVYRLDPDIQYVYRLRNDGVTSKNYYFQTDSVDKFNFVFAGDPQIGASGSSGNDGTAWGNTLNTIKSMFPETSLLVLAGDQVELCNDEDAYDYFFAPSALQSFAMARSVGNHESWYKFSDKYPQNYSIHNEHFNDPNTLFDGKTLGSTVAGSDYWYSYNNVLFMHINSNNRETAEHKAFMEAAIAANPNATWRVVVMHYAIYGAHYYYADIINDKRVAFAPIFDELGVDVVLNGHEHIYARSYMIEDGTTPNIVDSSVKSVTDPEGVLYITASTSTGSKYYTLLDDSEIPHIAAKAKNLITFTNVEVDEDSFSITTYNVSDKSVVDSFEIVKSNPTIIPDGDNIAADKSYTTSELNVKNGAVKYPDETGKTMTDGKVAPHDAEYKHEAYIGFYKNDSDYVNNGYASITVDLGKSYKMDRFVSYVASDFSSAAGVYAPTSMEIYVSDDNVNFIKAGSANVVSRSDIGCMPITVTSDGAVSGRYVQYRYTIGNGVWLMVAEVQAFAAHEHDMDKTTLRCSECGETLIGLISPLPDPSNDNLVVGMEYTTTAPNRGDGWDDDGKKLTDNEKSDIEAAKTAYSAWTGESVEILFDFEKPQFTDTYTVYALGGYWGIKLPVDSLSLEVYVSDSADSGFVLAASAEVGSAELIAGDGGATESFSTYSLTAKASKAVEARYLKLVVKHIPLELVEHIWLDEVVVAYKTAPSNILLNNEYQLSGCGNRAKYYANLADGVADEGALDDARYTKWFGFYYNKTVDISDINAPDGIGEVVFALDDEYSISSMRINMINKSDWGVPAPSAVNAYVSDDGVDWGTAVGTFAIQTVDDESYWAEIRGDWTAKYIKIEVVLGGTFAFLNEIEAYGVKSEGKEPDPVINYGDVNNDGTVDSADYIVVKRVCFQTYSLTEAEKQRADVNSDGEIDSLDYVFVKRIAFGSYAT